jgi:hypothetical protein
MRTNNNPQQPLVFFCACVECWESYNAALRALRLGYREVYWYRGVNAGTIRIKETRLHLRQRIPRLLPQ